MKYRAVIFDLDGTLLYTLGDIADALNRALSRFSLPQYTENEYKAMVGYGLKDVTRRVMGQAYNDDDLFENVYQAVLEEYRKFPVEKTKPYPGIPSMLDRLVEMGIAISVLSNKEDPLVQLITEKILSSWSFKVIRGSIPEVPPKPDPASVYEILKVMEVDAGETLFVGDSGADMHTAGNSGIYSIGVSWGYRSVEHLKGEGAQYIAFSPADIVHLITQS